ncbi:MAG: helix-turn-helix domain-containing protein [Alphaproteobacteria bacterium]|nr:helix-turn-helix domain-containing protein [Alphaproteobacteria bacterium]MDD9919360.1 helix-turn-helix domain-containing protein [Alphaproteobacteria bacterium]
MVVFPDLAEGDDACDYLAAMQKRLKKLTNGQPTKAALSIFIPDCQDLTDHIPDVAVKQGRLEVNELIEAVNPKVVFIDNISTFIRTGHENEGDSWAPVQEWAVQMRKQGRAIIFVHHANKEGKQRGSHKKEDVMDVVIQLKRPDDYLQGTDATRMLIRYTKARHLKAEDTQDIEAVLTSTGGELQWTWEAGDLTFQRAVELIKSGDMSMSELADEFGVSKSTIHRWKQKAIKENKLT